MSQPPQLLRQSLGIRIDSEQDWDEVARDVQLANQIVDRIPVLKAAKLNEVRSFRSHPARTAIKASPNGHAKACRSRPAVVTSSRREASLDSRTCLAAATVTMPCAGSWPGRRSRRC